MTLLDHAHLLVILSSIICELQSKQPVELVDFEAPSVWIDLQVELSWKRMWNHPGLLPMTWCSMYGGVGGCGCVLEIKLNIYPDLIIFISYAYLVFS